MPKQHIITHVNKSVDTSEHKIKYKRQKITPSIYTLILHVSKLKINIWKIRPKNINFRLLISATESPAVSAAMFVGTGTQPVAQSMLGD